MFAIAMLSVVKWFMIGAVLSMAFISITGFFRFGMTGDVPWQGALRGLFIALSGFPVLYVLYTWDIERRFLAFSDSTTAIGIGQLVALALGYFAPGRFSRVTAWLCGFPVSKSA